MTEGEKRRLLAELESALKKTDAEIQLLSASLTPHAQDCSLEPLTKSELIAEANRTIARLDELQLRRKSVKEALGQINNEDFGLCKSCGEPIPYDRLLLMPETRCCVVCLREESCPPE